MTELGIRVYFLIKINFDIFDILMPSACDGWNQDEFLILNRYYYLVRLEK